ncbi:MAG: type VI secretion system baseplate subunit TssE [Gemmatimonadetes bacterium]|nr:type VI secretion system baseplate subunit TssE [Gemmatimonadota bacterium]
MNPNDRVLRRSVLDRLAYSAEPEPRNWYESVRALKASVLRDIDWLLNTRRVIDQAGPELPELQDSVYHYGLPDITSSTTDSATARKQLLRQVEACIEQFEPRLSNVRVSESAVDTESNRRVRFVVEGMLRLHPDPEPISFDTVLDAGSGRFSVSGGG